MRYPINDYSISPKAKGWGAGWPTDRRADMAKVTADSSGTPVNVHKGIARLVNMLLDETERRGYRLERAQTGGYNNKPIRDTKKPSNHSWGLAIDLNWQRNPATKDAKVHTDFPSFLVPLWGRYGFAWGGNYRRTGFRDPMHLEFMGSPEDADDMTLLAVRDLLHAGRPGLPIPIPPASVTTYRVRAGDTLYQIARRLHIVGGWPALYELNHAVIGDDPGDIFPGQVLKLP